MLRRRNNNSLIRIAHGHPRSGYMSKISFWKRGAVLPDNVVVGSCEGFGLHGHHLEVVGQVVLNPLVAYVRYPEEDTRAHAVREGLVYDRVVGEGLGQGVGVDLVDEPVLYVVSVVLGEN